MNPSTLLDTALEAARRAGELLLDRYRERRQVEFKGRRSDLVTDADRASEALLESFLRERHPDHALVAEEGASAEGSGYRWVVDPLDGTVNYAHEIPHWCVSISVEDDRGPVAGVVYDPLKRELFAAARGLGATLNGHELRVTGTDRLEDAMLATGFAYSGEDRERNFETLHRFLLETRGLRRLGSAALDLAYVACGRFDGFWELGLKRWDVSAGSLIVAEAGGRVTGFAADEDFLSTGRLLASNGVLHEQGLRILAGM